MHLVAFLQEAVNEKGKQGKKISAKFLAFTSHESIFVDNCLCGGSALSVQFRKKCVRLCIVRLNRVNCKLAEGHSWNTLVVGAEYCRWLLQREYSVAVTRERHF